MPGGAAGAKEDAVDLAPFACIELQAAELCSIAVRGEAAAHCVFQRCRLLEYLLFHEVAEGSKFALVNLPIDLADDGGYGFVGDRCYGKIIGGEVDDMPVVQVNDVASASEEGGHVACDHVFALTEAEAQGGTLACSDDVVWAVGANDRDAVGALDVQEAFAHRFEEPVFTVIGIFFAVVVGDQVYKGFGISVGYELVALAG